MSNSRIVIIVHGLVQGVFFRFTTRRIARKLGLTGYVKNLPNGSVYIDAEGPKDKLNKLLEFSRKGPRDARVDRVEYDYKKPKSYLKSFEYAY
jgi:acylphosphatase